VITVGVTAFQGAVEEHMATIERAMQEMNIDGRAVAVRQSLNGIDALVIPGGESTTISTLMQKTGLYDELQTQGNEIPIMGTCAGCVLLASEVIGDDVPTLGLMDMVVERNAFGRQNESFQCMVDITGFDTPFLGIFIRAPLIKEVKGDGRILAEIDQGIVMAREKNKLSLVFHPELTTDVRIHQYFLGML
jgi:5'-phosphate synthase pdxT subunit